MKLQHSQPFSELMKQKKQQQTIDDDDNNHDDECSRLLPSAFFLCSWSTIIKTWAAPAAHVGLNMLLKAQCLLSVPMGIKQGCGYIRKARDLDYANEPNNHCVIGWCDACFVHPRYISMNNKQVLIMGQCIGNTLKFSARSLLGLSTNFIYPKEICTPNLEASTLQLFLFTMFMGPIVKMTKGSISHDFQK